MQRITTANRSIDKFGAGKDGFAGDPNATDLEPAWCDAVQEEIARTIEDQGEALDPGDLGQLAAVLNSWGWSGTPTVKSGATLAIASGGTLNASAGSSVSFGGSVIFDSGASFVCSCDVTFNEDVTIGSAGTDTCTINSAVVSNGVISALAGINIEDQTIFGDPGSTVSVTNVAVTEMQWADSGSLLPGAPGETRWNGTFFSMCDGANQVHAIADPIRGYDATFSTVNAIDSTTATFGRRIKHNEPVWVVIGSRFEGSSAPANLNYRIQVTGPLGAADILIDTGRIETANVGFYLHEVMRWTPTDDFPAETDEQNYSFLLRMGVSAGTLTADRAHISACSDFFV